MDCWHSEQPYFALLATKGIYSFRKLYNGLPFEASGTEAKNGGDGSKFAAGKPGKWV